MSVSLLEFIKPRKIELDKSTANLHYGKFIAEPFERGFATTIGNALRRHLISSLYGWAVTSIKIGGVYHEFSSIPGVTEDVSDIILNIKQLKIKLNSDSTPKSIFLKSKGKGVVKGSNIDSDSDVEIVSKDQHIATLDNNGAIEIEMVINKGRGYASYADNIQRDNTDTQMIPVDAMFSPITKVNFVVENTRVDTSNDYERLVLEVWTDGSIMPEDAVAQSAKILKDHLHIFINYDEEEEVKPPAIDENRQKIVTNLRKSVEELELSVRSYNCLKNANIQSIADLVVRSEGEMLKTQNFGRKSLNEIKDILNSMGLKLGINIDEYKDELFTDVGENS